MNRMKKEQIARHKANLPDGLEMAYVDQGEGEAIVLLHGYCGSSAYWEQVVPLLAQNYRVLAPDQRGHGQSAATQGTYTMELLANDAVQLLNYLGIKRTVVFGHSLGGYVTLAMEEKHPELLAGFALVHSMAYPDSEEGKANRLKAADTIRDKGVAAFVDGLVPKLFAPEHLQSMADKVDQAIQIGYGTAPDGAIGAALGMRERPGRNVVLAGTDKPVLLVAGEKDGIIPADKTFSVDKPNVTQAKLAQAGHMSMMETPEALADVMLNFLKNVRWN